MQSHWPEIVGLGFTFITALGGGVWYLASAITKVDTKVELILTNHLPHLDEDIKYLRSRIDGD